MCGEMADSGLVVDNGRRVHTITCAVGQRSSPVHMIVMSRVGEESRCTLHPVTAKPCMIDTLWIEKWTFDSQCVWLIPEWYHQRTTLILLFSSNSWNRLGGSVRLSPRRCLTSSLWRTRLSPVWVSSIPTIAVTYQLFLFSTCSISLSRIPHHRRWIPCLRSCKSTRVSLTPNYRQHLTRAIPMLG